MALYGVLSRFRPSLYGHKPCLELCDSIDLSTIYTQNVSQETIFTILQKVLAILKNESRIKIVPITVQTNLELKL